MYNQGQKVLKLSRKYKKYNLQFEHIRFGHWNEKSAIFQFDPGSLDASSTEKYWKYWNWQKLPISIQEPKILRAQGSLINH